MLSDHIWAVPRSTLEDIQLTVGQPGSIDIKCQNLCTPGTQIDCFKTGNLVAIKIQIAW